jgi:phage-related protein
MAWTVTFYSRKVEQEVLDLPPGIQANLFRTFRLVAEFGPSIGRPHTAPLGHGLFELRTLAGNEIVILLTVIKKTATIPARHMETARRRMKEVQNA